MTQKFDVVALGELLIDFTQNGISPQGNPLLEANPGGAPCNVLAMLQKPGKESCVTEKRKFGNVINLLKERRGDGRIKGKIMGG